MINFEKFNPEQPVFVQNLDISHVPTGNQKEIAEKYMTIYQKTNMQVVLVLNEEISSFECVYHGKYDSISKLLPILQDIKNLEKHDYDSKALDGIITYYERINNIDDILE